MNPKHYTLLLMLSFFSLSVQAQADKDYDDMSVEELMSMNIKTASASEEKASDAPNTTYIVTSQDIKERGYRTLRDVLEDLPDFEFQERSYYGVGTTMTARGIFSQTSFVLLRDGVRVNSMAAVQADMDQNYSIRGAERIEVVMGPSSAIYGADAFTCVINIITTDGAKLNGVNVTASYGMYGTTDNTVQFGYGKNKFSVSGGLSYFLTKDPKLPDYYKGDYAWYYQQYLPNNVLRANADDLTDTSVILLKEKGGEYYSQRSAVSGNLKISYGSFEMGISGSDMKSPTTIGLRSEFALYSDKNVYGHRNGTAYMRYLKESKNKWSLDVNVLGNHFSHNPITRYQLYYNAYKAGYTYLNSNGVQASSVFTYNILSNLKVTGGASYRRLWILPETADLQIPYTDSDDPSTDPRLYLFGTNPNLQRVPINFYKVNDENIGAFAQVQGSVKDILLFSAGVRADQNNRIGFALNPRASLTFKYFKSFQARLQYGEAFASPDLNATDTYYGGMEEVNDANNNFVRYEGTFFQIPNEKLKPNKLRSFEFNAVYGSPFVKISVGGYLNTVLDIPVEVSLDTFRYLGYFIRSGQTYANGGTQTCYGITAKVDFRKQFEEQDMSVNGYASFTYAKGNLLSKDLGVDVETPLGFLSPYTLKFGVTYRWKKLSVHVRGLSRSSNLANRISGQVEVPGFFLMSSYLTYEFLNGKAGSAQAFVSVRNMLNTRYYNASIGDPDSFDATPQDPIRVMVGISAGFGGANKKEEK